MKLQKQNKEIKIKQINNQIKQNQLIRQSKIMSQNRFSNSIMIIGMILIFYNTLSMIISIVCQFLILILSLLWSIIKIIPNCIVNYPISSILIIIIFWYKRNLIEEIKKKRIFQWIMIKVIGQDQQCVFCKQQNVDKLILKCGHFYHNKCFSDMKQKKQCPKCQINEQKPNKQQKQIKQIDDKYNKNNIHSNKNLIQVIKSKSKKITIILIISILIGYLYTLWWTNLHIFNSISQQIN